MHSQYRSDQVMRFGLRKAFLVGFFKDRQWARSMVAVASMLLCMALGAGAHAQEQGTVTGRVLLGVCPRAKRHAQEHARHGNHRPSPLSVFKEPHQERLA